MESLAAVISRRMEIEEWKIEIPSFHIPVRATFKPCKLPSKPDAKTGKNYRDLPNMTSLETRWEKMMNILISIWSLSTKCLKNKSWSGYKRSLWLSKVLWGYLLAADFPEEGCGTILVVALSNSVYETELHYCPWLELNSCKFSLHPELH